MKNLNNEKAIILIPSLEPDKKLLSYVNELKEHGLTDIIIVDDGSGEDYQDIFQKLDMNGCIVLHHFENYGKGRALKTGFKYIQENYHQFACIVTADSDGQHTAEDVLRILKLSKKNPDALCLGIRDFTTPGIPAKSLIGNKFASFVFAALYGRRLSDTQTGLRAFGMPLLEFMLAVKGDRFEYEIQMLIACVKADINIQMLPTKVIYMNSNEGTHFKPFRDSARIIGILFSDFIRFSVSSIVSAAVDLGIAWFLLDFLSTFFKSEYLKILTATFVARLISIAVNYLLNRNFVFREKKTAKQSLIRYLILCAMIILFSSTGVYALHRLFAINEKIGKIAVDTVLYLLSYRMQQKWVFAKEGTKHNI